MSATSPQVSIILPTLNCESYLQAAIESVLKQSFTDWELLIIDANSTDRTQQIIANYVSNPRVSVMQQTSRGLGGARNEAALRACGEFLAFIDADDLWEREKLEIHLQQMQKSTCELSFSGWRRIDDNGNSLGILRQPEARIYHLEDLVTGDGISTPSVVVIKKSAFDRLRGFTTDRGISEDIELWMRLLLSNPEAVLGIPLILNDYRLHSKQMTLDMAPYETARLGVFKFLQERAPDVWTRVKPLAMSNHYRAMAYAYYWGGKRAQAWGAIMQCIRSAPAHFFTDFKSVATLIGVLTLFLPKVLLRPIRFIGGKALSLLKN